MEKVFGQMSEFKRREEIELFESSDPFNTAVYHGKITDEERENKSGSAKFRILRMAYDMENPQTLIQYPGTDHFVEITGGGMSNSRGSMGSGTGRDLTQKSYKRYLVLQQHDTNLLLSMSSKNTMIAPSTFNFLTRIARINPKSYTERGSTQPGTFGKDLLDEVFEMSYQKLPEFQKVQYVFKLKDKNSYVFIHANDLKFTYESHVTSYFEDGQLHKMKQTGFARAKDGGSTWINLEDESGKEHKFYSPTSFKQDAVATWDEQEMIDIKETDPQMVESFVKLLGLNLQPSEKENDQ